MEQGISMLEEGDAQSIQNQQSSSNQTTIEVNQIAPICIEKDVLSKQIDDTQTNKSFSRSQLVGNKRYFSEVADSDFIVDAKSLNQAEQVKENSFDHCQAVMQQCVQKYNDSYSLKKAQYSVIQYLGLGDLNFPEHYVGSVIEKELHPIASNQSQSLISLCKQEMHKINFEYRQMRSFFAASIKFAKTRQEVQAQCEQQLFQRGLKKLLECNPAFQLDQILKQCACGYTVSVYRMVSLEDQEQKKEFQTLQFQCLQFGLHVSEESDILTKYCKAKKHGNMQNVLSFNNFGNHGNYSYLFRNFYKTSLESQIQERSLNSEEVLKLGVQLFQNLRKAATLDIYNLRLNPSRIFIHPHMDPKVIGWKTQVSKCCQVDVQYLAPEFHTLYLEQCENKSIQDSLGEKYCEEVDVDYDWNLIFQQAFSQSSQVKIKYTVFSLGCVLYFAYFGKPPYSILDIQNQENTNFIAQTTSNFMLAETGIEQIIRSMITFNSKERWDFDQILEAFQKLGAIEK